jgi:hypothetical protein
MKALSRAKSGLAAVAMILTLAMPPPARADILINVNVDSTAFDYNDCTEEPILLYGSVHLLITLTGDGAGGQHAHVQIAYNDVRALGLTTGTTYVVPGAGDLELNLTHGAANETLATRAEFIAPGGQNDFYVDYTVHITIDPNGAVTAEVLDIRIGCQ